MVNLNFLNLWFVSSYRLRKNLKSLIIVHPSWFIRTLLALTKPFIRYVAGINIWKIEMIKAKIFVLCHLYFLLQLQVFSESQVCVQLENPCWTCPYGVRGHSRMYQTVSFRHMNAVWLRFPSYIYNHMKVIQDKWIQERVWAAKSSTVAWRWIGGYPLHK